MELIFNLNGEFGNHFYIISALNYVANKYGIKCSIFLTGNLNEYIERNYKNTLSLLYDFITSHIIDNIPKDVVEINENESNEYSIDLDEVIDNYKDTNNIIHFNLCYFQNNRYYLKYKEYINKLYHYENENVLNYKNIISDDDVLLSIRRGNYFDVGFYVLSKKYYIDNYNKYFSGKNIYISSADIEWCKRNLTQDLFNNCSSITYLDGFTNVEFYNISKLFSNYICANSTFSSIYELSSANNKCSIGCINIWGSLKRPQLFSPKCIIYDLQNPNNFQYIDNSGIINNKFDEIHCILTLDKQERIDNVNKVFKDYDIKDVKFTYTFNKPIYKNIRESYPSLRDGIYESYYITNKNIYNRTFDCALNHYNIVKSAYKRGLNHILVFEDDINFVVDKDIFNKVIQKIPNDYDIIKFYNVQDEEKYELTNDDNIQYTKDISNDDLLHSCIMVAYSNKGMKEYIDMIEKNGIAACDVYYKNIHWENKINIYRLNSYFILPILNSYTFENTKA